MHLNQKKVIIINVNLYGNWDCNSRLNVFYEAGVFYRDVHDFIMAVQDRETYTFKNLSRISIKGLETEVGLQYADKLLLKGNLSYEKAVDMMETKISDGKPNAAYKQQIPNRPSSMPISTLAIRSGICLVRIINSDLSMTTSTLNGST